MVVLRNITDKTGFGYICKGHWEWISDCCIWWKKEIMSIIGHGVAQGGTYNNNKPGVAAAYAVLKILKERPILTTIAKRGQRLMDGLKTNPG